ncbi:NAD-dependent epimerase/dehydratase family protein [Paenibacillus sp. N4]|uniref:NAD-dependent epimerase/dehydratase family protein n=1 Tax=Paenibacillus vietnamensis TaxID=2590547 RepID=UPI001CD11F12|nr:NAD-dependent epimerase/dehydratase family protein [Paenibacillus vietnamensis]MCA0756496.1 NAD-dependent epimerase/dehydratase family protein [Paenibacillus vietnamensis]
MRKILITGTKSYIGQNLEKWLGNSPEKYSIETISLRNGAWREKDFSVYDVVVHVAGIAHIKEKRENAHLYYKVNRDLAYEVAQKAKVEGIKQFIFLSSMSVYGIENGLIGKNSPLKPKSNYGKSKLQAEELIRSLENTEFNVAIIRPPMVYGKGCKGNYVRLANLALKAPIFPGVENKRSMIYIGNLCEFLRLIIDDFSTGLFFPQNQDYVCTSEMVKTIAELHGTNIRMTKLFNSFLRLISISTVKKVFGDLVYEKQIDGYKKRYTIYDFETSIKLTEK